MYFNKLTLQVIDSENCMSEKENSNFNLKFYIDDNGNVSIDEQMNDESVMLPQYEANKVNESSVNNIVSKKNDQILKDIQNVNKEKVDISEILPQFHQYIFFSNKDSSLKRKKPQKAKMPSVVSSEEGVTFFLNQAKLKEKIESEKELEKQIRAANALVKKEKIQKDKEEKLKKKKLKEKKPPMKKSKRSVQD